MNFTEYYDSIVSEINKIDAEMKYLQGKRSHGKAKMKRDEPRKTKMQKLK